MNNKVIINDENNNSNIREVSKNEVIKVFFCVIG